MSVFGGMLVSFVAEKRTSITRNKKPDHVIVNYSTSVDRVNV